MCGTDDAMQQRSFPGPKIFIEIYDKLDPSLYRLVDISDPLKIEFNNMQGAIHVAT